VHTTVEGEKKQHHKKHTSGQQGQQGNQQYGSGNSNSGIRVRTGGAYSGSVVNGVGQQGQQHQQQYGSVNTISVIRTTRPGAAYSAGSNGIQVGVVGNSAGHYAIADDSGNFQSNPDSPQEIPVWAIAVIAIASVVLVALIVISVQLMLVIRKI